MIRTQFAVCLIILIALSVPVTCHADSAQVLPKGVFHFESTYYHYFDIEKRYNPDGDTEDLAVDYNRNLNSDVFPALAALDPFVGGSASVGSSIVDFTLKYRWFEFAFNYGITDKLSVGVLVPYRYSKIEVKSKLDTSSANVGKNPIYETPQDPTGSPVIPLAVGGVPLTKRDVIDLLGKGLDVNGNGTIDVPGFGYKEFGTWSGSMLGDIEFGAKYQLVNKDPFRLACTGGIRFPTGEEDDPDDLLDIPAGEGQTDLFFRVFADYLGFKNILINTTFRYDVQLSDEQKVRVPDDVNQPLTRNKETVDRNLGDVFEFELWGNYSFTKEISAGLKYTLTVKEKDRIDGNKGYNYKSLEDETDFAGHMAFVTLGYSTIQKYLEKKFPVPFYVNLEYRNRFAGKNNLTDSQYISMIAGVFF